MRIRLISVQDIRPFYELVRRNHFNIRDYFPKTISAGTSISNCTMLVNEFQSKAEKKTMFVFVSEDPDGLLTGAFFVKEIDTVHSKAEIAYFVDEGHQGKGLATAGVRFLVNYIFNELELNKTICRIATDNIGSNRVALNNGFVLEGVLRKEFRISNGKFIDINCYGRVRED